MLSKFYTYFVEHARRRAYLAKLDSMDDHLLQDIGITRGSVDAAIQKNSLENAVANVFSGTMAFRTSQSFYHAAK